MKLHTQVHRFQKLQLTLLLALATGAARAQQTYWLNQVNPTMVEFDTEGRARLDRSTLNREMSIGGQTFTNGLGTRAQSQLILDLEGKAHNFSGKVGIDDEVPKGNGSVIFKLIGDNKKVLWQSPVLHSDDPAQEVTVGVELHPPHPAVGELAQVGMQVAEEIRAGSDQDHAADRALGGDQAEKQGTAPPAAAHVTRSTS